MKKLLRSIPWKYFEQQYITVGHCIREDYVKL